MRSHCTPMAHMDDTSGELHFSVSHKRTAGRDAVALKEDIDAKRREISSDNLSMSIGELLNLYKDHELDIHPEFQRVFRWTDEQKSRLIESLLLGIPLPSIYVATNDKGVWEVVDGVQRLSTIFEFMGDLYGPSEGKPQELTIKRPLTLRATKYLPSLEGVSFADMDQALRLEFKRTRLDLKILAREGSTSSSGKFDLFERLNTYGAVLSPQELRNCILVSLNPSLFQWLKQLSEDEHFRNCTLLTENQLQERYDMDLALRFMALRDIQPQKIGDVHEFLRERMEHIAQDPSFDPAEEERIFRSVFAFLDDTVNGNAFRPWNVSLKAFRGAFSLGAFEGFGLAMGRHWTEVAKVREHFHTGTVLHKLWSTPEYKKSFSGLRARERMVRVSPIADEVVRNAIEHARSELKTPRTKATARPRARKGNA